MFNGVFNSKFDCKRSKFWVQSYFWILRRESIDSGIDRSLNQTADAAESSSNEEVSSDEELPSNKNDSDEEWEDSSQKQGPDLWTRRLALPLFKVISFGSII